MGAFSYGIGQGFSALHTTTIGMTFLKEAGRATAHGLIGGGMSYQQGGDFWKGFISNALATGISHGVALSGVDLGRVGGAFFSMGVGAGTSYLQGGNPWIGAGAALMSYTLNQLQQDGDGGGDGGKEKSVKSQALKEGIDAYGRGTAVPGAAIGFVTETKTGKMLSIGGKYVFKTSTYAQRLALARDIALAGETAGLIGRSLGVGGLILSGTDMIVNGPNPDNVADFVMGGVGLVPVYGWGANAVYTGVNEYLKYQTGMGAGTHIYISVTLWNSSR